MREPFERLLEFGVLLENLREVVRRVHVKDDDEEILSRLAEDVGILGVGGRLGRFRRRLRGAGSDRLSERQKHHARENEDERRKERREVAHGLDGHLLDDQEAEHRNARHDRDVLPTVGALIERLGLFEFAPVDETVVAHKHEGVAHDKKIRKEQKEEERQRRSARQIAQIGVGERPARHGNQHEARDHDVEGRCDRIRVGGQNERRKPQKKHRDEKDGQSRVDARKVFTNEVRELRKAPFEKKRPQGAEERRKTDANRRPGKGRRFLRNEHPLRHHAAATERHDPGQN